MSHYEALNARHEDLQRILESLRDLATDIDQGKLATRIEAILQKSKERVFRVAIVGEFSTGKSTLINALLGEDLLPTGLSCCTAVVTRLRCGGSGEESGIRVLFRKAGVKSVERERLREFLTFERSKGEDAPLEADITLANSTFLDHGIELLDTPGVNDRDARGEQITLQFLPQVDAIIFLTHAAGAFKESELEFLRDRVGEHDRNRVLFVVNACDRLDEERDYDDLRKRAGTVLQDSYEDPRVHLVSARNGLRARQDRDSGAWDACGMLAFAEDLDRMLTLERGEAELHRFHSHARRFRDELARRLEERIQNLGMDDAIRQRRCERVRDRIALLEQARQDALRQAKDGFREVRKAAVSTLGPELSSLRGTLEGMESSGKEGKQKDLTAAVEGVVSAAGSRALTRIHSSMRTSVGLLHEELGSQMSRTMGEVEEAFQEDSQGPMNVQSTSWDGLITVHTDRYVEEQQVEEEVAKKEPAITEGQGELIGGGLGGMIGLALLGPWGLLAGGLLGLGAAGALADSEQPGRKLFKTVQEWFVRQRVDADCTVADVRKHLDDRVDKALEKLLERTHHDVRRVFANKVEEFRQRLLNLEEPTKESAEQEVLRQRAEQMLEKLRRVPLSTAAE